MALSCNTFLEFLTSIESILYDIWKVADLFSPMNLSAR